MNLCSLFAKSLLFLAGSALISLGEDFTLQTSGTIFLPGVSLDSGWVSIKKHVITDYKYDDSAMCSAASAASVMAWWRNTKEDAAMTREEMYEMYDRMCSYTNWNRTMPHSAWTSYCRDVYGTKCNLLADLTFCRTFSYSTDFMPVNTCPWVAPGIGAYMSVSDALLYGIQNGYGMSLQLSSQTNNHAVTLWGGDYTNYGGQFYATSLYYTDSDTEGGLMKTSVYTQEDDSDPQNPCTNYYITISGKEWRIMGIDFLYHTRDNVPEPASSLLFMTGMAVLCWRRRY